MRLSGGVMRLVLGPCAGCCDGTPAEGPAFRACPCVPPGTLNNECQVPEFPCVYIGAGSTLSDMPGTALVDRVVEINNAYYSGEPIVFNNSGQCYSIIPGVWFPASFTGNEIGNYATAHGLGEGDVIGIPQDPTLLGLGTGLFTRTLGCAEADGCEPWLEGRPFIEGTWCEEWTDGAANSGNTRIFVCAALPGIYQHNGHCFCIPEDGPRFSQIQVDAIPGAVTHLYSSALGLRQLIWRKVGGTFRRVPAKSCCYCADGCLNGWQFETAGGTSGGNELYFRSQRCCGRRAGYRYNIDLQFVWTRNAPSQNYSSTETLTINRIEYGPVFATVYLDRHFVQDTASGHFEDHQTDAYAIQLIYKCCFRDLNDRVVPYRGSFALDPLGATVPGVTPTELAYILIDEAGDEFTSMLAAWGNSPWGVIPIHLIFSGSTDNTIENAGGIISDCTNGNFHGVFVATANPGTAEQVVDRVHIFLGVEGVTDELDGCSEDSCVFVAGTLGELLP